VTVPVPGRYDVWVGGATRSALEALVDRRAAGNRRAELSYPGQFMPFGTLTLPAGRHPVDLRYAGPDAAPGSAGDEFALGPAVLSARAASGALRSYSPARARALCSQVLDWVEVVRAGA